MVARPIALKKGTFELDEALTADPYPTWKKLEEMVDKGKVRNIGISKWVHPYKQLTCSSSFRHSFNIPRIKNLTANPLKYMPAVNQVELSYWNPQPELLNWCKGHGLLLEAYSPLGSSKQVRETLQLPEVQAIAKELNITPAQAIISWHVQRGVCVHCMLTLDPMLSAAVSDRRPAEECHRFAGQGKSTK